LLLELIVPPNDIIPLVIVPVFILLPKSSILIGLSSSEEKIFEAVAVAPVFPALSGESVLL
jgi:hypothetical protein